MTTITKEGDKALKDLEKKRKDELKELEDTHKKEAKDIAGKWADKETRLKKMKFWGKSQTADTSDVRYWALVNINALQNFVKYGANKVMDQIRVRTHANIMAREEIERIKQDKKGFDAKSFAFSAILIVMAAAIAFILVSNFFNYKTVSDDNIELSIRVGQVSGELANCQAQLAGSNPNLPPPATGGGSSQDNVLEG